MAVNYSNSPLVNYTKISPNKTSPRNHVIDTVTIHCVVGQASVESLGNTFAQSSRQASSNYGIGKDGRIGMYVEEKDKSWCSSNAANDNRAITIECASDTTHPYAVNDKVYKSLITLLVDICKRNNIKKLIWSTNKSDRVNHKNGCNMTVHRDYANKLCPGDYLYNLHGQIAEEVNKQLGATKPSPSPSASTATSKVVYKVQIKSKLEHNSKASAEAQVKKLKAMGIDADIVTEKTNTNASSVLADFKVGDRVKLLAGAYIYGTKTRFKSFVYNSTLYVRQIDGSKIVISTQKTGAVTGTVSKNDLVKI